MPTMISDQAKRALTKLADFQSSVVGDRVPLDTQTVWSTDVPGIGLDWAGYLFRCTWEHGMTTISAISADSEYLAVYVFSNFIFNNLHEPAPWEQNREGCEAYEVLLGNIEVRLSQLGLDEKMGSIKHLDQFWKYPFEFRWSEILGSMDFEDTDTEIAFAIDSTGKKCAVCVFAEDEVILNPDLVQNGDEVDSVNLRQRFQELVHFRHRLRH